jgi:CHAT domain-containing protein/Tfp pilus assembly protein PilF
MSTLIKAGLIRGGLLVLFLICLACPHCFAQVQSDQELARAKSLYDLGENAQNQRQFEEAERYYRQSVTIREKVLGLEHLDTAFGLNNLAYVCWSLKKYDEAVTIYRRVLSIRERELGPNNSVVVQSVRNLAFALRDAKRYAEAEPFFERLLSHGSTTSGLDHPNTAQTLFDLGLLNMNQAKYIRAEDYYKRALAIREKTLGPDHADTAQTLHNLGIVKVYQADDARAEDYYKRALSVRERILPADDLNLAWTLNNLGNVYWREKKFVEAESLHRRALAIREKTLGPDHEDVAHSLFYIGGLLEYQAQYIGAEEYYKRTLSIRERILPADHVDLVRTLNDLGNLYWRQDKLVDAESLHRRVVAIREKSLGPDHADVAISLANVAGVLAQQAVHDTESHEKYTQAQQLLARALQITEKRFGKDDLAVATLAQRLAHVYRKLFKITEAKLLYERASGIIEAKHGKNHKDVSDILEIIGDMVHEHENSQSTADDYYKRSLNARHAAVTEAEEKFGKDHIEVANALIARSVVGGRRGRSREAETDLKRALEIKEAKLGANSPEVADVIAMLATEYFNDKKYAQAEDLHQRALLIREQVLGKQHSSVISSLKALAQIYEAQGKYAEAESILQKLVEINRSQNNLAEADVAFLEAWAVLKPTKQPNTPSILSRLALHYAQVGDVKRAVDLSTSAAFALMAHSEDIAGKQLGNDPTGLSAKRRQYLLNYLRVLYFAKQNKMDLDINLFERAWIAGQWINETATGRAVQQMTARFATGGSELATLVRQIQDLEQSWRDNDARRNSLRNAGGQDRLAFADIQKKLDEIEHNRAKLTAQLDRQFPEYVGFARSSASGGHRIKSLIDDNEALVFWVVGEQETYVFSLTNKLNEERWHRVDIGAEALATKVSEFRRGLDVEQLKQAVRARGESPLFDLKVAHDLYNLLLLPVQDTVASQHNLLIVPSGVLSAIPFHLLVTDEPPFAKPPRLSAYRDASWLLKKHAVTVLPSVTSLTGLRVFASKEKAKKSMIGFGDPVFDQGEATPAIKNVKKATRAYTEFWKGASVNRTELSKALPRLEDTADEIKTIAQKVGAPLSAVYLREAANERNVKRLPLADYSIVYFATHGLVAGDIKGISEPSLALTLPKQPSSEDDGLLTASEISQLKLNADWVVLSACNTIAGEKPGAEALSGLARAFFYAGARSLLVSHWAVDSAAAAKLTTTMFDIIKSAPQVGRSDALRQAMLNFMNDTGEEANAYPAFWAPFVLVGEGWQSESFSPQVRQQIERTRKEEANSELNARSAGVCKPLQREVADLLKISVDAPGAFERNASLLRLLSEKVSNACPDGVKVFSGRIDSVINCYNEALFIKLLPPANDQNFEPERKGGKEDDTEGYIWLPTTESLDRGLPRRPGDWIIGMTDTYFYCLKSVSPITVLRGRWIKVMAQQ